MELLDRSSPEDLPPPTAEAILIRVAMARWLGSIPRADALRVLQGMAEDLATEESLSNVLLIRPPADQPAVNLARRQAIAQFRRFLPVWLQALDDGE